MKRLVSFLIMSAFLVASAHAGTVLLTDGSSVSGELKELENGDVVVTTAVGEITVPKDKIKTLVKEGSASSSSTAEGDMTYVNKVLERRAKFGNEDGIPRTSMTLMNQIGFTLGMLNYQGDALNLSHNGATLVSTSDFNGLHFGLNFGQSINDISAWEAMTGFSMGEKAFTVTSGASSVKALAQRVDVAWLFRLQKAIPLGAVESNMHIIPHLGLGPAYTYINYATFNILPGSPPTTVAANKPASALGAMLSLGADLQIGSALVGAKLRYLFSQDLTGGLNSSNLSAMLPQVTVGWAF